MKFGKRFMSMALALVMIFGLTVNASAADVSQSVTAKLSPDITVEAGGKAQAMADANGNPVYPVLYNGTTYLPVRAVGNMLGLSVSWDQVTRTVLLNKTDSEAAPTKVNSNTPSDIKSTDIAVQIDPGVAVKYNGKTQQMTDANGNTVYPMLYNGTTYLPVRAVSNMLNVGVEWNQNTRTVTLTKATGTVYAPDENGVYSHTTFGDGTEIKVMSDKIAVKYSDGKVENFGLNELSTVRTTLKEMGYLGETIDKIAQIFIDVSNLIPPEIRDPFENIHTSSDDDIKTVSNTCIAREWGELDWSTANDGYVTVKVNELTGPNTRVYANVRWSDGTSVAKSNEACWLTEGEYRIPLQGGSTEYVIELGQQLLVCKHLRTDAENTLGGNFVISRLTAKFKAEIDNPKAVWTMSTPYADFENAPLARAKAKELTKNCKTDAEKVTAIFNWVIDNIKYDHKLADAVNAYNIATATSGSCISDPNGRHITAAPSDAVGYYDLDKILTSKSGVCDRYAVLTVGMLRSVGVPCRVVSGQAYDGTEWVNHAWVEINSDVTDLNKTALGGGTGSDGWTRLDPTFRATGGRYDTSVAANDDNYLPTGVWY